jgi:hypothetical protein
MTAWRTRACGERLAQQRPERSTLRDEPCRWPDPGARGYVGTLTTFIHYPEEGLCLSHLQM